MQVQTHVLSGWCVANLLPLSPRERGFCMIAASASDLDGLGIIGGEEMYWRFHHIVGHGLLAAIVVCGTLTIFSHRRLLALAAYLALFHLHLIMDYWGSGPGWD